MNTDLIAPGCSTPPGVLVGAALNAMEAAIGREGCVALAELFLEDTPQVLRSAQAALLAGDIEVVRRAVHTLKSSSAMLGAKTFSADCAALEAACKQGLPLDYQAALDAITAQFSLVRAALASYLDDVAKGRGGATE